MFEIEELEHDAVTAKSKERHLTLVSEKPEPLML